MTQHSRGVDVDLSGLQAFADQLEANTEHELKPGAARAENEIQIDVRIGRSFPGGQVAAARLALIHAMSRLKENAARHIEAAEILTAAIKRALDNYSEGDRDAARRLTQIQDGLIAAVAAVRQAAAQNDTSAAPTESAP